MSDLLFVFLAIICYIILGSLYNYLVIKYDEIPYFKNKLKMLDIEYKKNNGKIMKYLDNIQLENDIYEYNTDPNAIFLINIRLAMHIDIFLIEKIVNVDIVYQMKNTLN